MCLNGLISADDQHRHLNKGFTYLLRLKERFNLCTGKLIKVDLVICALSCLNLFSCDRQWVFRAIFPSTSHAGRFRDMINANVSGENERFDTKSYSRKLFSMRLGINPFTTLNHHNLLRKDWKLCLQVQYFRSFGVMHLYFSFGLIFDPFKSF